MNLDKRIEEINQYDFSQYDVVSVEKLVDLDSVGLLLKHKKSGARVVVVTNDDDNKVFSIGFKTPPFNDTGLQHILEHSVLCGSRKYPVKDPFVELCKGSLNTFLNAMTYSDKTVYPVASCNLTDFKNIMDVYMDAVFYPAIYKHQEIFKQEGWHYELEDKDAELTVNGVVYNEMKGVFSSPDDVLSRYTYSALFPDTNYKYESGGDPDCIPKLTYEEFLEYHRNYYHPVNSYIYLYGDFDVQERLDYLDREYLKDFDKTEVVVNSDIATQKPFDREADIVREYAVTDDEPVENNAYLSVNKVVGTSLDAKMYLAMQVVDYALIMAPGARLKQALIDKHIGTDIYSSFETSMYQPIYSIVVKNADISKKQEFLDTVNEVLSDIVKSGLDERTVEAAINSLEFKYREADFGSYPKGLMYYLTMMDSWLYDETKPFIHIEAGNTFEQLKNEKSEGLFERIIQECLLDNTHSAVVSLVPKRGLDEEIKDRKKAELAAYKVKLSESELDKLIEDTKALKAYQDEESSQEDLKSIPMLERKDINTEPQPFYIDKRQIAGVDVIHHNMFTNKIAYMIMAFDCRCVPDELIPYLGILSTTLGLMDTENFTYPELSNEISINSGGISSDATIYSDKQDCDRYMIMYEFKAKVLYDRIDFVLQIVNEIIYTTKFDDYKRLKEIIARVKSRMESAMTNAGHTVAMLTGMSQFSPTAYYSNQYRGYAFYKFVNDICENFDDVKESVADNLNTLVKYIFTKDNLTVSFNADDDGYERFVSPMEGFVSKLADCSYDVAQRCFVKDKVKLGLTSSSMVQYVARCGNFKKAGYEYTGALDVLKVIFSYDYLWLNVRVKGGAYGCMSSFSRNGDMYMVSYRDPNLRGTNEIFEGAAEYIRNFDVSDRDMLKFIIGTIGEKDTPMNPADKGSRSFTAYLTHLTYEQLKKNREEIIGATVESIRALAPLIEAGISQDYLCVVGNQKTISDEASMFDAIEPLFVVKR